MWYLRGIYRGASLSSRDASKARESLQILASARRTVSATNEAVAGCVWPMDRYLARLLEQKWPLEHVPWFFSILIPNGRDVL